MLASTIPTPASPPPSALAIAGRAGHAFTPQAMMQGLVCHAKGVELVASGDARVHARVRSKRVHDVLLRADGGRLVVACTCPARSLGIDFCKHAWAALLEVDRQDTLRDLRSACGPLSLVVAPPPPPATKKASVARPEPEAKAAPPPKKKAAKAKPATPKRTPRKGR